MPATISLAGKFALLTSSGCGKAFTQRLAEVDAEVVIAIRKREDEP
jgi:hypothetical protein